MKESRPSFTARHVALTRASLVRPEVPTGDADAELRLYRSLAGRTPVLGGERWRRRMQVRTAFFDRETLDAIRRGVGQVVIVGAGYDGRALRFASPGVRWFEVDHPATQADKRERLAAVGAYSPDTVFVPIDLTHDDLAAGLRGAGHDPTRPTLFVVEGLLGYLPRATTTSMLAELGRLAGQGSRLAIAFPLTRRDLSAVAKVRHRVRGLVVSALGEPWLTRFGPDEPDRILADAGWTIGVDGDRQVRYQGGAGVLIGAEPTAA